MRITMKMEEEHSCTGTAIPTYIVLQVCTDNSFKNGHMDYDFYYRAVTLLE